MAQSEVHVDQVFACSQKDGTDFAAFSNPLPTYSMLFSRQARCACSATKLAAPARQLWRSAGSWKRSCSSSARSSLCWRLLRRRYTGKRCSCLALRTYTADHPANRCCPLIWRGSGRWLYGGQPAWWKRQGLQLLFTTLAQLCEPCTLGRTLTVVTLQADRRQLQQPKRSSAEK